MKKRKMIMFISILFMAIGFASVSAVLYLNGQIGIVGNTGDFDVYFSKAIENGVENSSIIKDRNHLEFTTELRVVDEEYVLDYEVTNASKQYDASIVMNCTGGNDFLRVSNEFDIEEILPARTTRKGTLTLRVIKTPLEEMSAEITCEITGNAVEREEVGSEEIKNEVKGENFVNNLLQKVNDINVTDYLDGNIHEMYSFHHETTVQLPENIDYRYIGSDPYNYVKFNGDEIWRIIGVFPDKEGVNHIKLIRNDFIGFRSWDYRTNLGINLWSMAQLKSYLNAENSDDNYTLTEQAQNQIVETTWFVGGVTTSKQSVTVYYNKERGNDTYVNNGVKYQNEWVGKIGLMYPSDYGYTYANGVSNTCYNNLYNCSETNSTGWLANALNKDE